jgi:hypothetical protein
LDLLQLISNRFLYSPTPKMNGLRGWGDSTMVVARAKAGSSALI